MTDSAPSVRNDAVKNHCTAHDRKWRKSPMGARFVRQEKAKAYLGEDRGCKRISVIRQNKYVKTVWHHKISRSSRIYVSYGTEWLCTRRQLRDRGHAIWRSKF